MGQRAARAEEGEEPGVPKKVLRTVTPPFRSHADREMNVIGWAYFLGLVILLVPLLPYLVLVWAISKVLDRAQRRRAAE